MADTARLTGAATAEVEALGQTWTLSVGETLGNQGAFESWLESRSAQKAHAVGRTAPPEVYAKVLAEHAANCLAGEYAWGGGLMNRAINSTPGRIEFLRLSLLARHPDVTTRKCEEIAAAAGEQVLHAFIILNPNTFPQLAPAAETPATGADDPKA